jgi:hypothetical protein
MCDVPHFICNGSGLAEEIVIRISKPLSLPRNVDRRVNDKVRNMDPARPHIASDGLSEDTLCCLGGCEPCEAGAAAQCRRVAGHDQGASAGGNHSWCDVPRKMQQTHHIYFEIGPKDLRIDVRKAAKRSTDRVVNDDFRCSKGLINLIERLLQGIGVCNVARKGLRV